MIDLRLRSKLPSGLASYFCSLGLALLLVTPIAWADGGIHLTDIAQEPDSGLAYHHVPAARNALFDQLKAAPLYTLNEVPVTPLKPGGAPGVALLDVDGDGDLDLYVPNGPGTANSLFVNQLAETGTVTFVDTGAASGAGAETQDSGGVCFGDLDNDGDEDLVVVSLVEANRLFENLGDGTFLDISTASGIADINRTTTSCSLGDVNGDGLLDLAIANTYDTFDHQLAIFVEPFALNQHNQLFLNQGGNRFVDVSQEAGVENLSGFIPDTPGAATITWAIALVDIDQDGDVDLVHANDQAAMASTKYGGLDRGFIQVQRNDGTGHFTDATVEMGLNHPGQWMGLAFGDANCDGRMDIFGSNVGDYMITILPLPYERGDSASRLFLGNERGGFDDPGVGSLLATPFGWGNELFDYDNDGDPDIVFHGGLDVGPFIEASNAGALLRNEGCQATFTLDVEARSATDHGRRNVQGLAVGDLDGNGFSDVVTVSNVDNPEPIPLVPFAVAYGSAFDAEAFIVPTFIPTGNPGEFTFSGLEPAQGSLSVELNGGNENGWVEIRPLGTVGLTPAGRVNRDGIGAVVRFTPEGLPGVIKPVLGGASYASQSSLTLGFGLGESAESGTLEILWPGGVVNRLYDVHRGERLTVPEIPCSFRASWDHVGNYVACVATHLASLRQAGLVDPALSNRLMSSAIRALRAEP